MKIFISHASENSEIVLKFARFLRFVSSDIDVFCSSENGSIRIGTNYVKAIFDELDTSDLFVPIISQEYYKSKFCMIELGVAYSYLCNRGNGGEDDYISPFALYPIQKDLALSGTPISHLQAGNLSDEADISQFLEILSEKGIPIGAGINKKLRSLKFDIEQIILSQQNIVDMAKIGAYFDDSVDFKNKGDIVSVSTRGTTMVVNYNMNPYENPDAARPGFISAVLQYIDKLDIGRYLDFSGQSKFCFTLTNFTNSLKRICIEFKYSDSNRILETFGFSLDNGDNQLSIPLEAMKSNALSHISEICFVIHPDDVREEEGMFKIGDVKIV